MRQSYYFSFLLILGTIGGAHSFEISETKLAELNALVSVHIQDGALQLPPEKLLQRLNTLAPAEAIMLQYHWLQAAAQLSSPSREQTKWVESLTKSEQQLSMANPEHPEQQLLLVSLANQASATQRLWAINQQAQTWHKQWQKGEWNWGLLHSTEPKFAQQAFARWLQFIDIPHAQALAHDYAQQVQSSKAVSNAILAGLAEKTKATNLYALLWLRTADQYSYQALARLPKVLDEYSVAEQLILASTNSSLQSQAIFSMLSQYGSHQLVQHRLLSCLDQTETKWKLAALLSRVEDDDLRRALKSKLSKQVPSAFRHLALAKLKQGDVQ